MQDFDRADLDDSMVSFEAAVSARQTELPPISVSDVLVAIDGSNQDATTMAVAKHLSSLTDARLHVVFAYSGDEHPEREDILGRTAGALQAQIAPRHGSAPAEQLFAAAEQTKCQILVCGAPYLEDYRELGSSSLGTHLEVVLHRRKQALLVTREPQQNPAVVWHNIILPINLVAEAGPEPAAWALHIARGKSSLHLLAVADAEIADAVRGLFPDSRSVAEIDEDRLAGLIRPEIAGLIATVQRRAAEIDLPCDVLVRAGSAVQAVAEFANERTGIIVTTCTGDCTSTGYQRVQALIRGSRNPVLVI